MTLICFASQKGSPGATAAALAVTASLKVANGRRKVLLEADTTGGTLAIRYRLPVEPGLLTLAAAVRGGLDNSDGLWRHAQELPGGLPVIVCPDGPEQVHAAMAAGGAQLGRFLNGLRDVDVMCDVGRLSPDSPALPFVAEASAVLMVARPTAEQLQPAARRMLILRPLVSNLGWVLVGQKPYGPADVEATYDFPVVGVMADDPRSVQLLERGTVSKRLRRQPFIRSATTLADTLSGWLSPLTSASQARQAAAGEIRPEPASAAGPESPGQPAPETALADTPPLPPDVDLTLLPPPVGEPDTATPHPVIEHAPEVSEDLPTGEDLPIGEDLPTNDDLERAGDVEISDGFEAHEDDEIGEGEEVADPQDVNLVEVAPEPDEDLADEVPGDWAPPDAPDPSLVPALSSAPLVPAPLPQADRPSPGLPSDETDPFPTENMHPVPPPPAPVDGRRDAEELEQSSAHLKESEGFGADLDDLAAAAHRASTSTNSCTELAEPGGLAWADIEAAPSSPVAPQLPPHNGERGAPVLNGAPPVPPSSLSLDQPSEPLSGPPALPPPLLLLDQQPDLTGTDGPAVSDAPASDAPDAPDDGEDDDWDGSEFTVTADLANVFAAPDFDAPPISEPRTEPPMPPMASVPPLPPPSTQLDLDAVDDRQPPPSPFPHEDSGADWTGW